MESNDTTTQCKSVTVEVPEDRVAEFYAFYARFLGGRRGRHGRRGPGGHGPHPGRPGGCRGRGREERETGVSRV